MTFAKKINNKITDKFTKGFSNIIEHTLVNLLIVLSLIIILVLIYIKYKRIELFVCSANSTDPKCVSTNKSMTSSELFNNIEKLNYINKNKSTLATQQQTLDTIKSNIIDIQNYRL